MKHEVTAIVLAGGRSARFGGDKLASAVSSEDGGRSVLDQAIDAAAAVASEVIVVGRAHRDWRPVPGTAIRSVEDPEPFGGPLQALAGALLTAGSDRALAVAGDMPSLVPAVLELLLDELGSDGTVDAAVLADPDEPARRQPLPLALRVAPARTAALHAREAGDRSLVRLLARLSVVEVPVDRWLALDPAAATLVDVDVPGDLDRLRRGARDHRMR